MRIAPVLGLGFVLAMTACSDEQEDASFAATMKSDGYALFVVDNSRQQQNDLTFTVHNADPNSTYVLLYSPDPPRNVGWFQFDPRSIQRCGGDIGNHCEVPGYGFLVDEATTSGDQKTLTLRDARCGCNADHEGSSWDGHWAVMRLERTDHTSEIKVDVRARKISGYADKPEISQLQ